MGSLKDSLNKEANRIRHTGKSFNSRLMRGARAKSVKRKEKQRRQRISNSKRGNSREFALIGTIFEGF